MSLALSETPKTGTVYPEDKFSRVAAQNFTLHFTVVTAALRSLVVLLLMVVLLDIWFPVSLPSFLRCVGVKLCLILWSNSLCPFNHLDEEEIPGLEVIKLSTCSTQLSIKFNMLINVKIPTSVGILTF